MMISGSLVLMVAFSRFEQTSRLINWASSKNGGRVVGLDKVFLAEAGVHGPSINAVSDLGQHECVLSVPMSSLITVDSWAVDTATGRSLKAAGFSNADFLGGGDSSLVERSSSTELEFQGSEALLVVWLLLQRRLGPGEQSATYFDSLEPPGVPGGIEQRSPFCWSEDEIRQRLAPSSLMRRALSARQEVLQSYEYLQKVFDAHGVRVPVDWGEYLWAWSTVVSRAVRFAASRRDRSTWTSLYLEPIGDLLNHEITSPTVFRFLNQATDSVQYHAADGGVRRGSELTYTYGDLGPQDSLLFYGFTLKDEEETSSMEVPGATAGRGSLTAHDVATDATAAEDSVAHRENAATESFDDAIRALRLRIANTALSEAERTRLVDCRRVLSAERAGQNER